MPNAYITTPIYYVNDAPHIGHAYTNWACDTWARFQRLKGLNVRSLTGTDEHGQKVQRSAEKICESPQDFVNRVSRTFRDLAGPMQTTFSDFIRTTEPRHRYAVQALWTRLVDRGQIYLDSYNGWYDIRAEAFLNESDLIEGAPPEGVDVQWVKEPSYFFRLSDWQEPLLRFYHDNPQWIAPETRRNEVIRFVEDGLTDLSVSRTTFTWGIPVPGDPKHVIYVWLDALTNYMSALGFPDQTGDFQKFWGEAIHVIGKDILRFHAVYWPAFLMAADLPLPKKIVAHGWWTRDGEKISKSLGNAIDPIKLINTFGADAVRYHLLREVPFGQDGDFSEISLIQRINSDLANTYGNCVQRVLAFIQKHCGGILPYPEALSPEDEVFLKLPQECAEHTEDLIEEFAFHRYAEQIWKVINRVNQYVDDQKPWVLKTQNPKRLNTVLYVLTDVLRQIAILTLPILPEASQKILNALGIDQPRWADLPQRLPSGIQILPLDPVFPRIR